MGVVGGGVEWPEVVWSGWKEYRVPGRSRKGCGASERASELVSE